MNLRASALAIFQAALAAADPRLAVERALERADVAGLIASAHRIIVVGAGKAGAPMAQAVEAKLGDRISAGRVNVKYEHIAPVPLHHITLREAGHPLPDESGLIGTREIINLISGLDENDLVLCLISGGGSALLELPVDGVTLDDLRELTNALLNSGATINEINTVRKHLSQVKGGQLARLARPARVVSLILSDVLGSPLDVIASGPTAPDPTTLADVLAIVEKHHLHHFPVPEPLLRGRIADTAKPNDPLFDRVQNIIVADNSIAAHAAVSRAQELGMNTLLLSTFIEGEAREVALVFAAIAKDITLGRGVLARPACIVASGETTVTVHGSGKGGRNQEFALAAAMALQGLSDVLILSAGTDGSDGPTDAAGAYADASTIARALALGLHAEKFLANNDSYHFFHTLGDLLITGPTNTNVNDLIVLLVK